MYIRLLASTWKQVRLDFEIPVGELTLVKDSGVTEGSVVGRWTVAWMTVCAELGKAETPSILQIAIVTMRLMVVWIGLGTS